MTTRQCFYCGSLRAGRVIQSAPKGDEFTVWAHAACDAAAHNPSKMSFDEFAASFRKWCPAGSHSQLLDEWDSYR